MSSPASSRGRARRGTASSAAAFAGVIGLPDPGYGPRLGDAGLAEFCRTFNSRAGDWLASRAAEQRSSSAPREQRLAR